MEQALKSVAKLRAAAKDQSPVTGLTHKFYRYPARFSPAFVATAIEHYSAVGDVVLDPYMGGGTTIVEAFARSRIAVGCDLNSLAVFVTRAKTTRLSAAQTAELLLWSDREVAKLAYHQVPDELANVICPVRTRNLNLARARPAKKLIALALLSLNRLSAIEVQDFGRAVLLNVAQWALNNRRAAPSLPEIRSKISNTARKMIDGMHELQRVVSRQGNQIPQPILVHSTAENLPLQEPFRSGTKASLVLTSPPYPGIHLLYHRWQVDGRKETPAPYWIADCFDGKGASYYNFADRTDQSIDDYFEESLRTLRAIREVTRHGGTMVQLVAFSNPRKHLPMYLSNMAEAGFEEVTADESKSEKRKSRRTWRTVPNRAWHAAQKGTIGASREVLLVHRAI